MPCLYIGSGVSSVFDFLHTVFPPSNNAASGLEESRLYLNSYSKSSVAQQVRASDMVPLI